MDLAAHGNALNTESRASLKPVQEKARYASIDTLRGVAVLGILAVNIWFFALPEQVMYNPLVAGGLEGPDFWAWLVTHAVFEVKMMSIFSMLFGAGIAMMAERAGLLMLGPRGDVPVPRSFASVHYRRMGWLLAFGIVHGYLIWYGDILFNYAICGMIAYPLRNLAPRWCIIVGLLLTLVFVPIFAGLGLFFEMVRTQAQSDPNAAQDWAQMSAGFAPTPEQLQANIDAHRGTWWETFVHRAKATFFMQLFVIPMYGLWKNLGMMLIGIGLFKLGFLTGRLSNARYAIIAAISLAIGFGLVALSVIDMMRHGFDFVRTLTVSTHFNYLASTFLAVGYAALVVLACKSAALAPLAWLLACTGRMAFSNYLAQSLICTTLFYGYGFGLFATLGRAELALVVFAIWALQLAWSPIWLKFFTFGPAEWLWRSLTYWKIQPLRRTAGAMTSVKSTGD
jgi:uncharacterized protein